MIRLSSIARMAVCVSASIIGSVTANTTAHAQSTADVIRGLVVNDSARVCRVQTPAMSDAYASYIGHSVNS